VKLNELKKLLTTTDLDLQMQLEKLKKLNDSIARLDKGIKEEHREQKQTNALASAKTPTTNPAALASPKSDQQQNRKATDAVSQTLKDLGGETAKSGDKLGAASQSMSLAEGHLGAGHPGDASALQGQAADTMQQVRDDLDKQRQKLLDELEHQVRQQVVANLQEMLDRQKSIRGATEAVVTRLNSADREVQLRVKQLAPAEMAVVRICAETMELVDQTQFSVALPPALANIKDSCQSVSDRLSNGAVDGPLVDDQKQIEQNLQDLLDTFKQLASQPSQGGQCHGCKGNKNKLLAELKTLRLLQTQVATHTVRLDAQRASGDGTPQMQQRISTVHDEQEQVHVAVQKLQDELEGP
jgi:bacterioferritin-associated ferredoxin